MFHEDIDKYCCAKNYEMSVRRNRFVTKRQLIQKPVPDSIINFVIYRQCDNKSIARHVSGCNEAVLCHKSRIARQKDSKISCKTAMQNSWSVCTGII